MNDEMLEQIMSSIVQLMARCDACELALRVVADRNGIGAEKMEKLIQRLTKLSTQGPLQQAETFDPGLAARIDWRSPPDKLPDPWLFDSEALLNELDRCRELVPEYSDHDANATHFRPRNTPTQYANRRTCAMATHPPTTSSAHSTETRTSTARRQATGHKRSTPARTSIAFPKRLTADLFRSVTNNLLLTHQFYCVSDNGRFLYVI